MRVRCFRSPLPNRLLLLSKNQYFETTTGWMALWLWTAMWKAPFLNGNNLSPWWRVPSGKNSNLAAFCWMATASWLNLFTAERFRSMNSVPHRYAAGPKGNTYNSSFFETTVARPISGHKYASTVFGREEWVKKNIFFVHSIFVQIFDSFQLENILKIFSRDFAEIVVFHEKCCCFLLLFNPTENRTKLSEHARRWNMERRKSMLMLRLSY